MLNKHSKIALFENTKIRKTWHDNQRYFSVVDIISALTGSANARDYRYKMKIRVKNEDGFQPSTICLQLKIEALDGKLRETDCSNTEGIFRIIQSIPSHKAEPFKRWLAKVWYERVEEIENPELAQDRMKKLYEQKWYPKEWIDKRIRGIAIRQWLTDEWKERWITVQSDYSILTAEISKATFGMTPSEYKKHKNISDKSKENLRDNMTDLELIFTMLWESVTTEISQTEEPSWFDENKKVSKRWWQAAWNARTEIEKWLWRTIISDNKFLPSDEKEQLK